MKALPRNIGLKWKFSIAIGLFMIVIMTIGASLILHYQKRILVEMLRDKGKSLSLFLSESINEPLRRKNLQRINDTARNALKDKEVAYILITDASNRIINDRDRAFNIPADTLKGWGIDTSDKGSILNLLLQKDELIHIDSPVTAKTNPDSGAGPPKIGTIHVGLFSGKLTAFIKRATRSLALITILIIISLSVMVFFLLNFFTFKPLRELVNASKRIASGELNTVVDITSMDEIGLLGRSFNQMAANLRSMVITLKEMCSQLENTGHEVIEKSRAANNTVNRQVSSIQEMMDTIEMNTGRLKELSDSSDELRRSSEETASAVLQLAASASEISSNMDTLSEEIEDTTSSLEEMTASVKALSEAIGVVSKAVEDTSTSVSEISVSIKEIEGTSSRSSELAREIKTNIEEHGMSSIGKTIEGMKEIKTSVELTGEAIMSLAIKSDEIDKIVQVIDEVTDRTTLLSLNAAILAAQAGEHGKPFSVVADEIKKLATDTASSTREISELIKSTQQEIKTAVQSMGQGITRVSEGLSLAENTGRVFEEIRTKTITSSDLSTRIDRATAEQLKGVNMVLNAVSSIEDRIGNLSKAFNEQRTSMERILVSIEKMRDIASLVKKATHEQKTSSNQMGEAAERVSNMSTSISGAIRNVSEGSFQMILQIEKIKDDAQNSVGITKDMSEAIHVLLNRASTLKEKMEEFRVD